MKDKLFRATGISVGSGKKKTSKRHAARQCAACLFARNVPEKIPLIISVSTNLFAQVFQIVRKKTLETVFSAR